MSFYYHAALKTRYRRIGGTWFCQLESDYRFTADASANRPFADSLLTGIKRLDRHPAVLGWTRMWATHLTPQSDLFSPELPVVFGPLETVTVHSGIDDNWWGPAPAAAMTAEEPGHHAAAAATAADLVTHDIDTDDLFALVTAAEPEPQPEVAQQHCPAEAERAGQRRQHRTKGEGTQCTLK